jgi:hypothetical protein
MLDIIFYFEIFILFRRILRMAETCNIFSSICKISSYFVVNYHLHIDVFICVFCVLYEFKT